MSYSSIGFKSLNKEDQKSVQAQLGVKRSKGKKKKVPKEILEEKESATTSKVVDIEAEKLKVG